MPISNYLKRRTDELLLDKMPKNEYIMDEIFQFDVRNLEATTSLKISQFIIGLSQFLIYFGSQINKTKVELMQKRNVIDSYIDKSDVKARTKAEKYRKVVDSNPELQQIAIGIESSEQELALIENREKYLMELINSFKRELTRRENELKLVRTERRL
jgi:hypothetical protein